MTYANVIYISTALILIVSSQAFAGSQSYLDEVNFECNRNCDSHFSSGACWEKTFLYFTNILFQTSVKFRNAVVESSKSFDSLKLEEIFNKTLTKFKSDPENSEILNDKDMKAYNDLVDILIAESFIKLSKIDPSLKPNKVNKCPDSCSIDSLVVWKSLFGSFIGLTLLTVAFVFAAGVFSKIQYKKYDLLRLKNSLEMKT